MARALDPRVIVGLGFLICVLVVEGAAVTHSYLWAAPLLCVIVIAVAADLPLAPFVGVTLLARVLTSGSVYSPYNRHSGSVNLSGLIALVYIVVAIGLLLHRRRGVQPAILAVLWLCFWSAVAVRSHGASTVTIREGVREASMVALAVIVYNAPKALNLAKVTRIIQIAGIISAFVALYQLATHGGLRINGEMRANGTFSHPNGASMYFAIAATASLWRYLELGRKRLDVLMAGVFGAATIATFSLSGLAGLIAMLMTFGALHPGAFRLKLGSFAVAALVVIVFLATPLGSERIAKESTTNVSSVAATGEANTSLAWRFHKWETLIPEWEQAPILGKGLGSTVTAEGTSEDTSAGNVPHNEYVRYLVETGAVGLITLLWGVALLIGALSRRRGIPEAPLAGTLGLAIVAGCLVNGLADNTFLYSTTGYAAAMIVAAVLSLPSLIRRRSSAVRAS